MASESTRSQDETRTIIIDGQPLRIAIRSGDGTRTPLLLMNGIGINLEVLQPFVDALDPAIEVIRFDVPGTGSSPAPRVPYRFGPDPVGGADAQSVGLPADRCAGCFVGWWTCAAVRLSLS
jgi:pimeloyl-ACP methyl ester carboxylesterase